MISPNSVDPSMMEEKQKPPENAEEIEFRNANLENNTDVGAEKPKDPESGEDSEDSEDSGPLSKTQIPETKYPIRETRINLPFLKDEICFNMAVCLIGLVGLWGLTAYCMGKPAEASDMLNLWYNTVIELFTWFYIDEYTRTRFNITCILLWTRTRLHVPCQDKI